MFPSFLVKLSITHVWAISPSKWHPQQSTAEDAALMAKALHVLPTF